MFELVLKFTRPFPFSFFSLKTANIFGEWFNGNTKGTGSGPSCAGSTCACFWVKEKWPPKRVNKLYFIFPSSLDLYSEKGVQKKF